MAALKLRGDKVVTVAHDDPGFDHFNGRECPQHTTQKGHAANVDETFWKGPLNRRPSRPLTGSRAWSSFPYGFQFPTPQGHRVRVSLENPQSVESSSAVA